MIDFITISLTDLHSTILSEQIIPKIIISSACTNVGQREILKAITEILKDSD